MTHFSCQGRQGKLGRILSGQPGRLHWQRAGGRAGGRPGGGGCAGVVEDTSCSCLYLVLLRGMGVGVWGFSWLGVVPGSSK